MLRLLPLALLAFVVASGASAQNLRVNGSASSITYEGTSALHDWDGTSRSVSGIVRLNAQSPARTSFTISAPVASFDSGNGSRDRKMREATETERFPTVTFASQSIQVRSWDGAAGAKRGRWRVTGDLTLHGRTRRTSVDVEVRQQNGRFIATGGFPISLAAYGVERPGVGPVKIGDTITLSFRIVAGS